ncbi:MAG: glycoside hydrolase family 26 protein [Fimbriimonas sp.]
MLSALLGALLVSATLPSPDLALIDRRATPQTKALYANLKRLSKIGVLFGHQHATEYGRGWAGDADRSDVKSVVGSHPAVIGVDFAGLSGRSPEAIEAEKVHLRKIIVDTYDRGGVVTISWHISNPVSGGGFNARREGQTKDVKELLPGGTHHAQFKKILTDVADLAKRCKGKDGNLVPMIFRPWHEFDGDWFWWGRAHCTIGEFTDLYRLTVSELRDVNGVHNFIYAFSPDCRFNSEGEFLERYPGDEWVDMVGFDDYADFGRDRYDLEAGLKKLTIVSDFAKKHAKVAAFTETGLESIPNPTWWTETLLKTLKSPGLEISYVLVWRNDQHSPTHYYAPVPGHSSAPDFQRFYDDPFTLFENDLKSIYR